MLRSFKMGHQQGTSANMFRTQGNQGALIQQGATRMRSQIWPVACSAQGNWIELGKTKAGGGNT